MIKEIIFRASGRTQTPVILVANSPLRVPLNPLISVVQVKKEFDEADFYIVKELAPGDLVITADIPLADAVLSKGALALNPRGELYDAETIKERLAVRDLMAELRDFGMNIKGPKVLSMKDSQAFANKLDQVLSRNSQAHRAVKK
jgi:uncharacterized protein YaiI (UPF0178 family)